MSASITDAPIEWWYRYSDGPTHIDLDRYPVIRHTEKGVWLRTGPEWDGHMNRKFVLSAARKRFAYPTRELAWESFIARKQSQVGYLKAYLAKAQAALEFAKNQSEPPENEWTRFRADPKPVDDYY